MQNPIYANIIKITSLPNNVTLLTFTYLPRVMSAFTLSDFTLDSTELRSSMINFILKSKLNNITDVDLVIFPIFTPPRSIDAIGHWATGCLDITKKRITWADSISSNNNARFIHFAQLLIKQVAKMNKIPQFAQEWEIRALPSPQQVLFISRL